MKDFSVLMSLYAREDPSYFKKAIDSIMQQSVRAKEIVIVKDGPITIALDAVLTQYVMQYPDLFKIVEYHENHGRGLGNALRVGVISSTYDIIARMDTDDIARKDRFEKQIIMLSLDSELDVVGSYIQEFDNDITNLLSVRKVPLRNEDVYAYAKKRNPFNHMTVMFRKAAVLRAGNYVQSLNNEDYYLWARMILRNSKMSNIPECLVFARTGRDLFKRRGGIKYALTEIKLQWKFFNIGFVNIAEAFFNVFIRTTIRILPNKLRGFIYTKYLRG